MGDTLPGGVLRARAIAVAVPQWRRDWLAGVVRLELRNLSGPNPFELRRKFLPGLAQTDVQRRFPLPH